MINVIIASGDMISGVTSWAFRLKKAFEGSRKLKIHVLNCLNLTETTGDFDAITPKREHFNDYVKNLSNLVIIPNYFWDLFDVGGSLKADGHVCRVIGFCRSDSEADYYLPLSRVAQEVDHFVAVSELCGKRICDYLPEVSKSEVTVLPNAVEVPSGLNRQWQTSPVRIAYGGRFDSKQKRLSDLVPLLKALNSMSVDYRFQIAGAGRFINELIPEIESFDRENRVEILGKIHPGEMPVFWRNQDIVVSFSAYEGLSNSLLESMAQGCVPIITETQSGISPIKNYDSPTTLLHQPGDTHSMAKSIRELITAQRIEKTGRDMHEGVKEYSMSNYSKRFEQLMSSIINR